MKRTPEELIAHHEEQVRKRQWRLARARDPQIGVLDDAIKALREAEHVVEFDEGMLGPVIGRMQDAIAELEKEALKS